MRDYDRTPYRNYLNAQTVRVEAEIQRLIRERGDRTHEEWLIYLENKARLAELDQRRNAFTGELDV